MKLSFEQPCLTRKSKLKFKKKVTWKQKLFHCNLIQQTNDLQNIYYIHFHPTNLNRKNNRDKQLLQWKLNPCTESISTITAFSTVKM